MYSPAKRYHFPEGSSSIPYAGQKRWHTMLGLIFGLVTCTWIFSGMLSMDPFGWESSGQAFRLNRALGGGHDGSEERAASHFVHAGDQRRAQRPRLLLIFIGALERLQKM